MANSWDSTSAGNSSRDSAPPSGRAISPSSIRVVWIGNNVASSASTAWVNTRVRDWRQVPPERATTFRGRVMNSSFFNSGIAGEVSRSEQELPGEQCRIRVEPFIEGYVYSVNERISIFIDLKGI